MKVSLKSALSKFSLHAHAMAQTVKDLVERLLVFTGSSNDQSLPGSAKKMLRTPSGEGVGRYFGVRRAHVQSVGRWRQALLNSSTTPRNAQAPVLVILWYAPQLSTCLTISHARTHVGQGYL